MGRISSVRIKELLKFIEDAVTPGEKGSSLEELIRYLFTKVSGVSLGAHNQHNFAVSQEIDIAFWNDREEGNLDFLPNVILVECKNWDSPVSSQEVSWFDTKLRSRGLSFGILVAAHGITGNSENLTAANNIIAFALGEQRQIIVITLDEIRDIRTTIQVINLIKKKLCDLAVHQTTLQQ